MRLGIPTRILGRRGLRAYETRPPADRPHLSISLAHLRDVLAYLAAADIQFYRLASELALCGLDPSQPSLPQQLDECAADLAALGAIARGQGLRLTLHAPLFVQLAAVDQGVARRSAALLEDLAALLDRLGLDADGVIVVHIGGPAHGGALDATIGRWVARYESLPLPTQRRLALEHEDDGASLGAALRIHAATGVPLVFDYLHFQLNNPERWTLAEGLAVALATWPHDRMPKVHFSSPRTELRAVERRDERSGRRRWMLSPPRPGHHADFINAWEFAAFIQAAAGARDFDVMLEAKASDVALLRLRQDLRRYVPEVAAWLWPTQGVLR